MPRPLMGHMVIWKFSAHLDQDELRKVFNKYDVPIRLPYPQPRDILYGAVTACVDYHRFKVRNLYTGQDECSVAILQETKDKVMRTVEMHTVEVITYDRRTGRLVFDSHEHEDMVVRLVKYMKTHPWRLRPRVMKVVTRTFLRKRCCAAAMGFGSMVVPVSCFDLLQRFAHCINLFRPREGRASLTLVPLYKAEVEQFIPFFTDEIAIRCRAALRGLGYTTHGRRVTNPAYENPKIYEKRKLKLEWARQAVAAYEHDFGVELPMAHTFIELAARDVAESERICAQKRAIVKREGRVDMSGVHAMHRAKLLKKRKLDTQP